MVTQGTLEKKHRVPSTAVDDMSASVQEAAAFVRRAGPRPQVGIILGSGLGELARDVECDAVYHYADIPHFSCTTAAGHAGRWIAGTLAGVPCVVMQGRCHMYEGNSPQAVALPVHVMKQLGIELLIVSCASGGLNPHYRCGDVLVIEDHINLTFRCPIHVTRVDGCGLRSPLLPAPYDPLLIDRALQIARARDLVVHRGVYAWLCGPTYETRAEYRMLRQLGADVVGMSTVPEVLAAAQAGMRVLGLSAVTNECRPDCPQPTEHQQVVDVASFAAPKMRQIVQDLLGTL